MTDNRICISKRLKMCIALTQHCQLRRLGSCYACEIDNFISLNVILWVIINFGMVVQLLHFQKKKKKIRSKAAFFYCKNEIFSIWLIHTSQNASHPCSTLINLRNWIPLLWHVYFAKCYCFTVWIEWAHNEHKYFDFDSICAAL